MSGKEKGFKAGQSGGVMVEAVLWLSFLVVLIPSIIEMFFLSNTYLGLSQITREALLTQITIPNSALSPQEYHLVSDEGVPPSAAQQLSELKLCCVLPECNRYKPGFTKECAHTVVKWRIRRLIESNQIKVKPENLTIKTAQLANNVMSIDIEAAYDGMFWLFDGIKLHGRANGGYVGL